MQRRQTASREKTVLLTVTTVGEQLSLEFRPRLAKYIADEVPGILREMNTATKH
jgi:hypothetical protein